MEAKIPDREKAARALCRLEGHPENIQFEGKPMWQSYLPQVDAVLAAIGYTAPSQPPSDMPRLCDTSAVEEAAVNAAIASNIERANQALSDPAQLGWFVGEAMRAAGGKANPQRVRSIVMARFGMSSGGDTLDNG